MAGKGGGCLHVPFVKLKEGEGDGGAGGDV